MDGVCVKSKYGWNLMIIDLSQDLQVVSLFLLVYSIYYKHKLKTYFMVQLQKGS